VSLQAAGLVELVDLFPTLMSMAGAVVPVGLAGSDLRQVSPKEAVAYAEFGDMLFLRQGRRALTFRCTLHNTTSLDPGITSRLLDDQAALGPEFYALHDVVADPMQAHDLRGQQPAVFNAMRKRLIALRTGVAAIPQGEVSPERLWQLRMAPSDGYW
jgi:arylsulfatase A-like enzyme